MAIDRKMLTRKEYMEEAKPYGFCLHPIDVNIAKMQQKLQQEVDLWQDGQVNKRTLRWVSRNPMMSISKVSVCCTQEQEAQPRLSCRLKVRVTDKRLKYIADQFVWYGSLDELKRMLNGNAFLKYCKSELLWLNYALENSKDEDELLNAGWKLANEVLSDYDIVFEQLERILTEWDEVVPECDDFEPVIDIMESNIFANDTISAYGLKISPRPNDGNGEPGKCYIEALAYDLEGNYKASILVASGNHHEMKEEIEKGFSYSTTSFFYKVFGAYLQMYEAMRDD